MNQTRLKSNSAAILTALLNRGVSVAQAARESGIAAGMLTSFLHRDKHVHYRTASRLRKYFGENAVEVVLPTARKD